LSFGADKTLRIWDVETGKKLHKLEGHTAKCTGRFSPDGKHILSYGTEKTLRWWDAKTGQLVRLLEGPTDEVRGALFLKDSRQVAAWSKDQFLYLWDAAGREVRKLELGADWTPGNAQLAFTPDGRRFLSSHRDGTVRLRELVTGKELGRFENCPHAEGFSFSPDAHYAAAGSFRSGVYLWRLPK
jgi:WD40 repeat protein